MGKHKHAPGGTAVAILSNPIHLVYALEAMAELEIAEPIFLFSTGRQGNEKEQIDSIFRFFELEPKHLIWQQRHPPSKELPGPVFSCLKRFEDWARSKEALRALAGRRIDTVLAASIHMEWMLRFLGNLPFKRLIALDDGMPTLEVAKVRQGNYTGKRFLEKRARKIECLPPMEFFTLFNDRFGPEDTLHANKHRLLKQKARNVDASAGDFWFFGQPLLEGGLLTENTWIDALRAIAASLPETMRKTYVLHPRETPESTETLKRAGIFDAFLKNELPAEIEMVRQEKIPSVCGGFFSAVSENIAELFDEKVEVRVYRLPDHEWQRNRDFIRKTMERWQTNYSDRISVVPIEVGSSRKEAQRAVAADPEK